MSDCQCMLQSNEYFNIKVNATSICKTLSDGAQYLRDSIVQTHCHKVTTSNLCDSFCTIIAVGTKLFSEVCYVNRGAIVADVTGRNNSFSRN